MNDFNDSLVQYFHRLALRGPGDIAEPRLEADPGGVRAGVADAEKHSVEAKCKELPVNVKSIIYLFALPIHPCCCEIATAYGIMEYFNHREPGRRELWVHCQCRIAEQPRILRRFYQSSSHILNQSGMMDFAAMYELLTILDSQDTHFVGALYAAEVADREFE